jgi:hypothetical protein
MKARVPGLLVAGICVAGIAMLSPNTSGMTLTKGRPSPTPVPVANHFSFTSDPGDWVGAGLSESYTAPTASLLLNQYGYGGFNLYITQDTHTWNVLITPPSGKSLQVGKVTSTTRISLTGGPTLDVGGDGRGCNTSTGDYTISAVKHDASGNITGVQGTFDQYCDGSTAGMHGSFSFNE